MSEMWSIKYRPRKLNEVLGQLHVTKYFEIILNKYFEDGKPLPAGALFGGKSGVGKTTVARVIASILNCPNRKGIAPCGECSVCRSIVEGKGGVIEIDSAFFGKAENVRELRGQLSYHTFMKYQVVILDECHALSSRSFDILLKLLEEPPEKVFFILVTTEVHRVKETIKSRLLEFSFKTLDAQPVYEYLKKILDKEKVEYTNNVLEQVYFLSGYNFREAIVMLEKLSVIGEGRITKELIAEYYGDIYVFHHIIKELRVGDYENALKLYDEFAKIQPNLEMFLDGFVGVIGNKLKKSLKGGEGDSFVYTTMLKQCYRFMSRVSILGGRSATRLLFFDIVEALGLLDKVQEKEKVNKEDVIDSLTKGW